MKARYKYRIYPNHIQIIKLNQLFGCCRYVWNSALAHCNQLYTNGHKRPSYVDLTKQFITQAKRELVWLKEVASTPLQQSLKDLDQAYRNFFNSCTGKRKGIKVKPPKCKSRKSRQAVRFVGANYKIGQDKIYFPKVGKIKIIWSRPLASNPSSVTIIKDSAGRYFASFVVETCAENLPKTENSIGIDLGISTFATLSNGEKFKLSLPLKKNLKKLGKFQRKFAKTELGSKRREKARVRVAKLSFGMLRKHAKVKDISFPSECFPTGCYANANGMLRKRTDFLHKLSTDLAINYDTIVLEDLNVSGMVKKRCDPATTPVASGRTPRRRQSQAVRPRDDASRKRCDPATTPVARERRPREGTCTKRGNADQERERAPRDRKLAKAISDLGWRQFRTLTEAKCEKYGREFRTISRWEPTSQKWSNCGFKGGKKELNVREWTCLNCGTFHDRDINAAVNILEAVQPKTKVEIVKGTVAKNPVQLSLFNEVAEGQRSIIYRTRRKRQTEKPADSNDVSTHPESFLQRASV
ncbi:MAG: transposase [Okeania sp. SIO3H1]|nr:transposase [Okeania sp. SIO3H1]